MGEAVEGDEAWIGERRGHGSQVSLDIGVGRPIAIVVFGGESAVDIVVHLLDGVSSVYSIQVFYVYDLESAKACDEQAADAGGDGGSDGAAADVLSGGSKKWDGADGNVLAVDAKVVLVDYSVGVVGGAVVPVVLQLAVHVAAGHAQHSAVDTIVAEAGGEDLGADARALVVVAADDEDALLHGALHGFPEGAVVFGRREAHRDDVHVLVDGPIHGRLGAHRRVAVVAVSDLGYKQLA